MNKNGQINGLGILFVVFIAVVVGFAMFSGSGGIASNVAQVKTTYDVVNQTITFPANGATVALRGQALYNVRLYNATGGEVLYAGNYTVNNYQVGTDGVLYAYLKAANSPGYNSKSVNASYTYEPLGYVTDAGARGIADIIVILCALAIAVIALVPTLRSGILQYIDR